MLAVMWSGALPCTSQHEPLEAAEPEALKPQIQIRWCASFVAFYDVYYDIPEFTKRGPQLWRLGCRA